MDTREFLFRCVHCVVTGLQHYNSVKLIIGVEASTKAIYHVQVLYVDVLYYRSGDLNINSFIVRINILVSLY
jgi:hypothetical protein